MNSTIPKVYIETSIIGYYTSRPSRDLVTAARQRLTRDWWEDVLPYFTAHISALVLKELSQGEESAVKERIRAVAGIPILQITEEAENLSESLLSRGLVPRRFSEDALHIALGAAHGMDFLVTWNFTHINNAVLKSQIEQLCQDSGYECPTICSPEELPGEDEDDEGSDS